jgi:hypothetical protein
MKFLIVLLPPSLITSSLLGTNILLRTLFSNTPSLCSSLNVRDHVSHPYKTMAESMDILTFTFLDSWRKTKDSGPNCSNSLSYSSKIDQTVRPESTSSCHLGLPPRYKAGVLPNSVFEEKYWYTEISARSQCICFVLYCTYAISKGLA